MDEPTTDLDPVGKRDIFKLAQVLRNEMEGIILVEHETEHVLTADRILLMHEGRIVLEGPPREILADPHRVERHGVRPLQTTVLLSELGLETDALTIRDAAARIRSAGWRVGESARERLNGARQREEGEPVVRIRDLVFSYGASPPAVDGVSLDVGSGEFVALVGQNGCGKTTLAKHLNGLHSPTEGEVEVLGKSHRRLDPARAGTPCRIRVPEPGSPDFRKHRAGRSRLRHPQLRPFPKKKSGRRSRRPWPKPDSPAANSKIPST